MPFKVMLVGGDIEDPDPIRRTLETLECEVYAFRDVWLATRCAESECFDLVMLDLRLLDPQSVELVRSLRASPWNAQTSIAMLVGPSEAQQMGAGFPAGIDFFLPAPLHREAITRIINLARGAVELRRRRDRRVPFSSRVSCWYREKYFQANSVNLGEGGMLLELPGWVPLDEELQVQFELPPSQRALRLCCRTFRKDVVGQVAVRFLDLSHHDLERIQQFLRLAEGQVSTPG